MLSRQNSLLPGGIPKFPVSFSNLNLKNTLFLKGV